MDDFLSTLIGVTGVACNGDLISINTIRKVILIPKDWQEFLLQTSDPIKSPQLIKPMEK